MKHRTSSRGPIFSPKQVPTVRTERGEDNEDSKEVRRVYGAKVGILVRGAKKVVIRPRLKTDPPGLVPYIVISGEHYTSGDAWKDARSRL